MLRINVSALTSKIDAYVNEYYVMEGMQGNQFFIEMGGLGVPVPLPLPLILIYTFTGSWCRPFKENG